jgi:hypothetical protein
MRLDDADPADCADSAATWAEPGDAVEINPCFISLCSMLLMEKNVRTRSTMTENACI